MTQEFSTSRAWSWRHAIALSDLPPMTRHVLQTLSLKMDGTGGSCYPPISELVTMTGLDKKTVLKHLDIAESEGWIVISQHGFRGQKWKRNEYFARWPGRDTDGHAISGNQTDDASATEGGVGVPPPFSEKVVELGDKGGGNGSTKVVEQLHQDKILPSNIPSNIPDVSVDASAGELFAVPEKSQKRKIDQEIEQALDAYRDMARAAGLAQPRVVSPERRAKLALRLAQHGLATVIEAIGKIGTSSWCRGENDNGWRADLDFLLQPKSFVKLLEGAYDDRPHRQRAPPPRPKSSFQQHQDRVKAAVARKLQGVQDDRQTTSDRADIDLGPEDFRTFRDA